MILDPSGLQFIVGFEVEASGAEAAKNTIADKCLIEPASRVYAIAKIVLENAIFHHDIADYAL